MTGSEEDPGGIIDFYIDGTLRRRNPGLQDKDKLYHEMGGALAYLKSSGIGCNVGIRGFERNFLQKVLRNYRQ